MRSLKKMKDKKRSLEYEKKFKAYLFSFDFKTHKEICEQIGLGWINFIRSTPKTRRCLEK